MQSRREVLKSMIAGATGDADIAAQGPRRRRRRRRQAIQVFSAIINRALIMSAIFPREHHAFASNCTEFRPPLLIDPFCEAS
jgi:hypothetical protein